MLKRIALTTLAAAATFTTAALAPAAVTPAAAQGFSIYFGSPQPRYYAPPPQRVWVPAHWEWRHGRQVWVNGHWQYQQQPAWNTGWGNGWNGNGWNPGWGWGRD